MPRSGMRAVGSFVADLTCKAFARYGFSAAGLITEWAAIAGSELAAYTRPERLRWPRATDAPQRGRGGATLVLRVEGARALDVQFGASQIIARINAYFGYAAVGGLRIVQGPVDAPVRPAQTAAPNAAACGRQPAARQAAGEPVSELPQELAGIGDVALRDALYRLGAGVRQGPRSRARQPSADGM
jgi:hypothetical protein